MHKGLLSVLCWLLLADKSVCAQTSDSLPVRQATSLLYLKLNPLALLELDGGIGISGEYIPARSKLGFQLQIQPIFFSYDVGDDGFESPVNTLESGMPTGIKLRPEVRLYFKGKPKGLYNSFVHLMKDVMPFRKRRSPVSTYAAVDFLYKRTQRERLGEFNVTNGNVSAGFRQRATYTDIKKVVGVDVKVGAISPIGRTGRWLIEAYIGIGYRQKTYSYKNIPAGAADPERNNIFEVNTGRNMEENLPLHIKGISLPAGFQLVYRL